jgi:hypothetical protein
VQADRALWAHLVAAVAANAPLTLYAGASTADDVERFTGQALQQIPQAVVLLFTN